MTARSLLSTQEVARLLKVAETTIKRWADEQTLPCVKTPGGHRKFATSDVLAFAEKHQYPLTGLLPPPMAQDRHDEVQLAVQTRNYSLLADAFFREALAGNRDGLYDLVIYLYTHQIPFSAIADNVMRPAMAAIGDRWSDGVLEVDQEHRASQSVLEVLLRFGPEMHHKTRNGLLAVCSCMEGELHSIGLQCVARTLETEGWAVHMLGANTPADSLHSCVKRVRPHLVSLSSTVARQKKNWDMVRSLTLAVHAWNGIVIFGGKAAAEISADKLGCDFAAHSLEEALAFLKEHFQLKPGPKKASSRRRSHQ